MMLQKIKIISTLTFIIFLSFINKSLAQTSTKLITAPIVKKGFVKKNGVVMDYKEYYIQGSVQDYFIKFCESDITSKELKEQLNKIDSEIKTLILEVEFREGNWDICYDTENLESRVGEYIVIHRIIEK